MRWEAKGLADVDLNYPDHVGSDPRHTGEPDSDLGLAVNGLAMGTIPTPRSKSETAPIPTPRSAARQWNSPNEESMRLGELAAI